MDLAELERVELEDALASLGIAKFHGRQIFRWIYERGVTDVAAMTNLSRDLRATLSGVVRISTPAIVARQTSIDGTTKFLLRLADDRHIGADARAPSRLPRRRRFGD